MTETLSAAAVVADSGGLESGLAPNKGFNTQTTVAATLQSDGFGGKTITMLGGFALLVNNITGPGQPALAIAYQQGGWFVCTLWLVLFSVLSALACAFMCEAMTKIKGNEFFQVSSPIVLSFCLRTLTITAPSFLA